MLLELADKLQDTWIIMTLTSTGWTAALLAILHYYSMFVMVGLMAIVDLRVLGFVGRDYSATGVADRIYPWVWTALVVNTISGFIMFAGAATAYVPTKSFHVKLLVVLTAVILAIVVRRKIPAWDNSADFPASAKWLAALSLLFFVGAIVMGVEVPAISGVG